MTHFGHLLAPLRIGNVVLKNRLVAANSLPHFLQGPEPFPAEPVIDHLAGLARNGAAARFFLIGDCNEVGSVQTCIRSAFGAASQL
jgi:2,4-dienoyl-CoA reductase-like NADH-dependent reductase (Old Yellow Enzyme family)